MIRIERDPAWWTAIASHPAVIDTLHGLPPEDIGAVATRPDVIPFALEHGGFLVAPLDALGFARDLHAMFTPAGWGREAGSAFYWTLEALFFMGAQVINAYEVEGNPRSRPLRRCGFECAGEWRDTPFHRLRLWVLTHRAWRASPGRIILCPP